MSTGIRATALVTGATDGVGRLVAERLAASGAAVIVHGRHEEKGWDTVRWIQRETGNPGIEFRRADFASLGEVRQLAHEVASAHEQLNVVINNAGIGFGAPGSSRETSRDGHELRLAVNYLAPFLLTHLLLPIVRRSVPARIVNVASLGQAPIDFDDVMIEKGYSGSRAYGQSKLAQITSGFTLAGLLPAAEVTVNSLHPATYMPTKMVLQEVGHSIDTLARGEAATRRLVSDPALAGVTGRFYDRKTETRAHPAAYDPGIQQQLWKLSLDLTGMADPGL